MKIEQNTISRDWTVLYRGHRYFVNFTISDGQTLLLCNREHWQIHKETEEEIEEFNAYVFSNSNHKEKQQAAKNARIIEKLIQFCVQHWDNNFMQQIQEMIEQESEDMD